MKREIEQLKGPRRLDQCCPGHDDWPNDVYRNRRSVRARPRDIKREHRYVRRVIRAAMLRELFQD
jgi:hypothetical protein